METREKMDKKTLLKKIFSSTGMKLKIFVRWNTKEKNHSVELTEIGNQAVAKSYPCGNAKVVFGCCFGLVETLKELGHHIEMPKCLQRTINMERED
jgi:hypothetical protein